MRLNVAEQSVLLAGSDAIYETDIASVLYLTFPREKAPTPDGMV